MRRHRPLAAGAVLCAFLIAVALVSLVWTPAPPAQIHIALRLRPPLAAGPLGTDQFGRDVLSLVMAGAWNSLSIALLAVLLGLAGGVAVGTAGAALRGIADEALMRAADVVFAFPAVISAIVLAAIVGPGRLTAVLAIGIFNIPVFARLARSTALGIWQQDYVLAARGAGRGRIAITASHVLPNIAGPLVVQATIQLGLAVLSEAALGFLGLSVPPPSPSWGRMLQDAQTFLGQAPHLAIVPGIAIALAVLGFNLLGDGLRDLLDPKTRAG